MKYSNNGKEWIIPPNVSQLKAFTFSTATLLSLDLVSANEQQTPVSMATPLVHLNPDVFEDPDVFDPERFIADPSLKKSVISFSWGSRQCLGRELSLSEMYMVHGTLWRYFGCSEDKGEKGWLELFETDISNIKMVSDRFVPSPKKGSKGIRIVVRGGQ